MSESVDIRFLYVISAIDNGVPIAPCKIGITRNLDNRLSSLQTGNSTKLEIVSAIRVPGKHLTSLVEQAMHEHFSDHRLMGEWFDLSPIDAAIGSCIFMREFIEELVPEKTWAVLENLGISGQLENCFKFIKHCEDHKLPLDSIFTRKTT